jgi:aminoglycoside 6-adenylyltransferase
MFVEQPRTNAFYEGGLIMRSEQEMMDLIINVAKEDERIRAVLMVGSRANPSVPKDIYQDYDITYFVKDVTPFYDNSEWIEEHFGKPVIMQKPENMTLLPPEGDGHFTYLMIFEDGNRIDLSIEFNPYIDDREPAVTLLDKEGFLPLLPAPSDKHWHIMPPTEKLFTDCCNEFWWCLNNVAKGIARNELPYTMKMFNY